MKLDKFTRVCINIVLILLIALLVKSLVTVPRDLQAKTNMEYRVVEVTGYARNDAQGVTKKINDYVNKGWKFHSCDGSDNFVIFEQ